MCVCVYVSKLEESERAHPIFVEVYTYAYMHTLVTYIFFYYIGQTKNIYMSELKNNNKI